MTTGLPTPLDYSSLSVGDVLPPLKIDVTATLIAAGAIATRDFMPVHHDRDYANQQGAPDIFMNILSDTGYCSRFLTDWAGPDAMLRRLAIRRWGFPCFLAWRWSTRARSPTCQWTATRAWSRLCFGPPPTSASMSPQRPG